MALEASSRIGPIVDCNVHLWDQRENPVFWLSDRTLVRDMIGDYDSLPDTYSLADYCLETAGYDVQGVIWSDAGAADPLGAAAWVTQQTGIAPVVAIVTLGNPMHVERLATVATASNVATRVDAMGTIFGDWTTGQVRTWLLAVTDTFGPERCMLGSDLPIENLRSGFGQLYAAYDDIFSGHSDYERARLFHGTAEEWYGTT